MSEHEDPISLLIRHKYLMWKHRYIYCWRPDAEDILANYRNLEPLIRESLESSLEETHDRISFNCYMLGNVKEKSRAVPHIVFACGNVKVAREAQRIIVSSGLLRRVLTPFGTEIMPQLPSGRLFKIGGADSDISQLKVDEVRVSSFHETTKYGRTAIVRIITSTKDEEEILATGSIVFGGMRPEILCLTAAHAFLPESRRETMNWVEDVHIETFLYQPPRTSFGAYIMRKYGGDASPQYISPWQNPGMLDQMHDRWIAQTAFDGILTLPLKEYSKRIRTPKVLRKNYKTYEVGRVKRFSSDYDWAILTLDEPFFIDSMMGYHAGLAPVGVIDSDDTLHKRAIALTFDEAIPGSILPGSILERPPGAKEFHRLFHFRIDGEAELVYRQGFVKGDCGSPIINAETGQLYGHIVYGCQDERSAFVISASEVMESIICEEEIGEVSWEFDKASPILRKD